MANVLFKQGSYAQYKALTPKDAGTLYFTTDTKQIFKGDIELTKRFFVGTTAPTANAALYPIDSLYVNTAAHKAYQFDGTQWNEIGTLISEVKASGDGNVVTGFTFENGVLTLNKTLTVYTTEEIDQKFQQLATEGSTHTHTNKTELDKIAEGDKAKWDAAAEKAHTHSADAEDHKHDNKALLDTYDQTNDDLKDAVGKKHEHAEGAIDITGTKDGEKVVSVDDGKIGTTLSLAYDSTNKKIQLKGISDEVVAELDATAFIKDGMVQNVSFDPDTKKLTITFNVDSGDGTTAKESIEVDMTSLVDTYTQGNGITISGNVISVKVDNASESFLTVGEGGVKLSGVQTAINTAASTAKTEAISAAGTAADQKITALNLGSMSQKDAANYNTAAEVDQKITDAALVWGSISE